MGAVSVIKSILYEFQPFRVKDAVHFIKALYTLVYDLLTACLDPIELMYQQLVDAMLQLSLTAWLTAILWCIGWATFIYAGFGSLFVIISLTASIFLNLGTRQEGEMSAYSVFNRGYKQLLGTLTAEQFDAEIRHSNHRSTGNWVADGGSHLNTNSIVQLDDVLLLAQEKERSGPSYQHSPRNSTDCNGGEVRSKTGGGDNDDDNDDNDNNNDNDDSEEWFAGLPHSIAIRGGGRVGSNATSRVSSSSSKKSKKRRNKAPKQLKLNSPVHNTSTLPYHEEAAELLLDNAIDLAENRSVNSDNGFTVDSC